jgi:hypothetical protein
MAIAFTDQPTSGPFHRTTLWHRTAPRELFKAWFSGDDERRWTVWKKHLAKRKKPKSVSLLAGKRPAIFWGWPEAWRRDEIASATSPLARSNAVLAASRATTIDLPQALEVVAAAYALPDLARQLTASAWWSLAETLHALATDAQQIRVDALNDADSIVRQQLLAGELPLVLSYLFPELQPMRSLRDAARQSLSEGLIAATDGEGLLHARLLKVAGPLWACWTRCRKLGEKSHRGVWTGDAETQYRWLVRRMIRILDADGRVQFADERGEEEPSLKPILAASLDLVGDKGDASAAAAVIGKAVVPRDLKYSTKNLPDASLESAWSCLAVLSNRWCKNAPRLSVSFADDPLKVELSIGGRKILAGTWTSDTIVDGQRVTPSAPWDQLCWQSDKKCDFLEIGLPLGEGVQLERHMVLSKRDHVLLIADIVSTTDGSPHELQHSYSLPLARRVSWLPETETRDGVLACDKQRTAVLPLGLQEWRADPRGGTLVSEGGRLTLTAKASGKAVYSALIVDLDPLRSKEERTWRQLTVAESLQIVARDVAVGFRAQSGDDQFVIYRSLGKSANRSVLGQNISTEFAAGRFEDTGLMSEWISIETE